MVYFKRSSNEGEIYPTLCRTVTKYVFIESYKATPDDIAARAYEVSRKVMIKETCFGLLITGKEEEVDRVIDHIRALDSAHIYVKDRVFPWRSTPCRANLGGARPGYFGHEYEMGFIRRIAVGLEHWMYQESRSFDESKQKEKGKLPVKNDDGNNRTGGLNGTGRYLSGNQFDPLRSLFARFGHNPLENSALDSGTDSDRRT
jgi:putative methanogenesis marker protein 6